MSQSIYIAFSVVSEFMAALSNRRSFQSSDACTVSATKTIRPLGTQPEVLNCVLDIIITPGSRSLKSSALT